MTYANGQIPDALPRQIANKIDNGGITDAVDLMLSYSDPATNICLVLLVLDQLVGIQGRDEFDTLHVIDYSKPSDQLYRWIEARINDQ